MSRNPLRKMEAAALYAQIGRLIESAPNLAQKRSPNPYRLKDPEEFLPLESEDYLWLGRVEALVGEALGLAGESEISVVVKNLRQYRVWGAAEIMRILYRALAQVELELPAPASGAFIPAGNTFDALKAVQRIFNQAAKDILIVDPYLDEKILTEFALFVDPKVKLHLLTDSAGVKPTLIPALARWIEQYGDDRPVELRVAAERSLHDRLIATDNLRVWTVGQSFKDLAARTPTSFVEVDSETAKLKIEAYLALFASSRGT